MDMVIRILEGALGSIPVLIGFFIWLYKRGGIDATKESRLAAVETGLKAIVENQKDAESDLIRRVASTTTSGVRPAIDNVSANATAQIGALHEKVNKINTDLAASLSAAIQSMQAAMSAIRSDIEIIKTHYGHHVDTLRDVEISVTSALQSAEGEKVRIEKLEAGLARAEENLQRVDRALAKLEARLERGKS